MPKPTKYQASPELYHFLLPWHDSWGKCGYCGAACFKAAAKMLVLSDLPTDLIQHFIWGMSFSSNEEFNSTCTVQLGFTESLMFEEWARFKSSDIITQLDLFSLKLLPSTRPLCLPGLDWWFSQSKFFQCIIAISFACIWCLLSSH